MRTIEIPPTVERITFRKVVGVVQPRSTEAEKDEGEQGLTSRRSVSNFLSAQTRRITRTKAV